MSSRLPVKPKTLLDASALRRKRQVEQSARAASKRSKALAAKRRNDEAPSTQEVMSPLSSPGSTSSNDFAPVAIETIFQKIMSNDHMQVLDGVTQLRAMLIDFDRYDGDHATFAADVVNAPGVIERLIHLLVATNTKASLVLQFETAWALASISSRTTGADVQRLVTLGAIDAAAHLLSRTQNQDLRVKLICLVCNIVAESVMFRDMVFASSIMQQILSIAAGLGNIDTQRDLFRHVAWFLTNMFRDTRHLEKMNDTHIETSVTMLVRLLDVDDTETRRDACWALANLSDNVALLPQLFKHELLLTRIVQWAGGVEEDDVLPALQIAGNMACGDDTQCQTIINAGILHVIATILTPVSSKKAGGSSVADVASSVRLKNVRRDALWVLSCVAVGMPEHIEAIISTDLFPKVVRAVRENESYDIKLNAIFVLVNAIQHGTDQQIRYIVGQDAIPHLCDVLVSPDADDVLDTMCAIERILQVGMFDGAHNNKNIYATMMETCGGIDKLEALLGHENEKIFKAAQSILDKFFELDTDEQDDDGDEKEEAHVASTMHDA